MASEREVPTAADPEQFHRALDTLPCLIWTALPDGQVEFFNRRYLDYFGLDVEECLVRWHEGVHPDDRPALFEEWQRVLVSGESGRVESRLRRFDGVYRRFMIRSSPLRDSAGRIVRWYGVNTDIEDQTRAECALEADLANRKRAEALLADENRLLEMIARGCSLSVVLEALCELVERSIGGCHCTVLLVDPTWKFRHGAAPSLPSRYNEFLDGQPIRTEGGPCAMAASMKTQVISADLASDPRWTASEWRTLALELGLRSCWSTPVFSGDLKVLGTFAIYHREPSAPAAADQEIIRQFTQIASIAIERNRSEAALRQSEAFLVKAQTLSLTGSFSWNVTAEEITWSKELYRMFGFDPSEPVTLERIAARLHPDDLPQFDDMLRRANGDGSDFDYEHRLVLPDGSLKHVHVLAHGTRDREGHLLYIGAAQDVTERRLSDIALDKVRAELARMARITSLGALTASIAHEVNQPLAGVITNASTCLRMLGASPPNVEGALETARRTIRDGNRAADVISRLRALFGKQGGGSPESMDLNDSAREIIALSSSELQRHRISVFSDLDPDLPQVTGDRVQLQQVILNLLLNAMEAMDRTKDRPRVVAIRTVRKDHDRVELSVHDSGVGFGGQDPEALFETFRTTKDGGMGIGLAVSRSIIERHGGQLWAEPNPEAGATFSFWVPRALDATIPASPEPPPSIASRNH